MNGFLSVDRKTLDYRLRTNDSRLTTIPVSRFIPFVVEPEVEAGPREMNRVLADLVPQDTTGRPVLVARHFEKACKIAQSRDDDERGVVLGLTPAQAADFVVRNERRIGPDAVFVKPALDAAHERRQISVVDEHHRLADRLALDDGDLVEDEEPEHDADGERHPIVRRPGTGPGEQGAAAPAHELDVFRDQSRVGDEETDGEDV